jgi:hypothetical protein
MKNASSYLLPIAAAGFGAWWFFTGDDPIMIARSFTGRGKKLTIHTQDENGDNIEAPKDLLAQASAAAGHQVTWEAYMLASVSASEHARAGDKEKALIQRVMLNRVGSSFGADLDQVIHQGKGLGRGQMDIDGDGEDESLRQCATTNGPWEQDLFLAESNLAGEIEDVSSGARFFVHKTGFKTITKYERVCAKWYAKWGIVPIDVGGVSSLRVFVKESVAKELVYA